MGKPWSDLSSRSSKSTGTPVIRLLPPSPYVKRLGRKRKKRQQVEYTRYILSQASSLSTFQISCPDGLAALWESNSTHPEGLPKKAFLLAPAFWKISSSWINFKGITVGWEMNPESRCLSKPPEAFKLAVKSLPSCCPFQHSFENSLLPSNPKISRAFQALGPIFFFSCQEQRCATGPGNEIRQTPKYAKCLTWGFR